ncbi:carbohydrate esterase family 4 protein [Ilyonectria destructans]|nr:carbohydrate esterase family 4 protein [Ilyonectria destructans]
MANYSWPGGAKAAVSFTMDNLGEPLEIQLGLWPADGPFGTHPSIKQCLPFVLEILDRYNVKATYFAEAWSLDTYSDNVKDMIHRGHEVAWHAYQHEIWDKLSPEDEEANFLKSVRAAQNFGIKYAGFRPPGGTFTETTSRLLKTYGFHYISPLQDKISTDEGITVLPFKWRDVDAYYYAPEFGALRQSYGEQEAVMEPQVLKNHLSKRISETIKAKGHLTILFHPFLQSSHERLLVMEEVVKQLANDPEIWCAPCNEVVQWIQNHPDKQ